MQVLTHRMEVLERRLADRMVVDFVRREKAKAEAQFEPEPKLAAEIVARKAAVPLVEAAANDAEGPVTVAQLNVVGQPTVHLDALKLPTMPDLSRMNRFTKKVTELYA